MNQFGIKELYDICLKTTLPLEIGNKTYIEGETILHFDQLQLASLSEQKSRVFARGGYSNINLIMWENTSAIDFVCDRGVASRESMAILSNAQLTSVVNNLEITHTEKLISNEQGKITTSYLPLSEFFIYDKDGTIPTGWTRLGKTISGLLPDSDYTVRYIFEYTDDAQTLNIGMRLLNGYLKMTAKMRLKDDTDGHVKTAVLEIPKLQLMSDLSIRLGSNLVPAVSVFHLQGIPVGERNNQYVCQIYYLDTDIDADI